MGKPPNPESVLKFLTQDLQVYMSNEKRMFLQFESESSESQHIPA